ncbi:class I SAM-dependent methyltransferase [Streptomyces sp. ME19-01-6]|uniref:class I SAM-dependent methyltransferase n=1 Tax=Streptomyces sp. ME19-01-6 TaxID=3028686 RepID=UPI0029ADAD78|nr:methyltransferase domain-containing protein [Streptomyces sp. ME19-01-6]MDX3232580.1 methyltransferase domain-containing protein [Streptomyces sp. ME19-01-6]
MTQIADAQSFDRFALDYDRFVSLLPGQNTAWLLGLGLKGKRALDVGCGSGHAVEALADGFEEVVGLDLSAPLIEIAKAKRARPNVRYVVEDLFGLKDEDGFDLVYSHTMLHQHHLEDYRAGLEHLKSLVRPGGTVALIDNVCDLYPTPPRKAYTWPALWSFPSEIRRVGLRDAWFQLLFWHSRPWLAHLLSDRYLSREQFRELYGSVFPGARFDDLGFALAMAWTAPPSEREVQ